MTSVVVDASLALAWCFPDEWNQEADRILVAMKGLSIHVPAVWSLEIANAILVGERRKRLRQAEILRFIALLESLEISQDHQSVGQIVSQVLPTARAHGLSAYDAAYLELAIRHNSQLATLDAGLRKAARQSGIKVF